MEIDGYHNDDIYLTVYEDGTPSPYSAALCKTCGAIVGSTSTHNAWHKAQVAPIVDD